MRPERCRCVHATATLLLSNQVAAMCNATADVASGGETAFPRSKWLDEERQTAGQPFSKCARGGVAALARKGGLSGAVLRCVALLALCWAVAAPAAARQLGACMPSSGRASTGGWVWDQRLPPTPHPAPPSRAAGNAVLFWDTKLGSMRQDKFSLHTGCPVLEGTKW